MQTPVLFTIFRRRETALAVFAKIRQAQPARLYIAADGPREDHPGEADLCKALRQEILSLVDWDCHIETLFRERNLGCGRAMSEAVSWFFKQEAEGIILEDDCQPEPGFFKFCEAALKQYRDNEQIMCINGTHCTAECDFAPYSCGFSRYAQIWGWATWRRAWQWYDFDVCGVTEEELAKNLQNRRQARRWMEILTAVQQRKPGFDTWDFQWSAALLRRRGLAVVPNNNLITNIGYQDATHDMPNIILSGQQSDLAPLHFPDHISANEFYDYSVYRYFYKKPPLWKRLFKFFFVSR